MKNEALLKQLKMGLQKMGLVLNEDIQQQLLDFLYLLQKWNKAYNLTAIRSLDQMLTHHLLDSLAIAPYVQGQFILDVGTGAGFPGIPLALYYPQRQFVLLDSNGKKMRFLQQVQMTLKIQNIKLIQERMEKWHSSILFDVIICRAVGDINAIIQDSLHLLNAKGSWLFMKGTYPEKELECVKQPYTVYKLDIPGIEAARHVVQIDNAS